jgi:hypothetical protein
VFFADGRTGYAYWTQACWWSSRGPVRPEFWEPLDSTHTVFPHTGRFAPVAGQLN